MKTGKLIKELQKLDPKSNVLLAVEENENGFKLHPILEVVTSGHPRESRDGSPDNLSKIDNRGKQPIVIVANTNRTFYN